MGAGFDRGQMAVHPSTEIVPVDSQIADVISAVISRATSSSGRSTSGFGRWQSIVTFFEF